MVDFRQSRPNSGKFFWAGVVVDSEIEKLVIFQVVPDMSLNRNIFNSPNGQVV
jgi:hypothetical protein